MGRFESAPSSPSKKLEKIKERGYIMTKYDELIKQALKMLDDDELFVKCVDECIRWDGTYQDDEVFDMDELDEMFYGVSLHDFLNQVDFHDFDLSKDFWMYDRNGNVITVDSKIDVYRDITDNEELLDNLIEKYSHLDINWIDRDLDELLDEITSYTEDE